MLASPCTKEGLAPTHRLSSTAVTPWNGGCIAQQGRHAARMSLLCPLASPHSQRPAIHVGSRHLSDASKQPQPAAAAGCYATTLGSTVLVSRHHFPGQRRQLTTVAASSTATAAASGVTAQQQAALKQHAAQNASSDASNGGGSSALGQTTLAAALHIPLLTSEAFTHTGPGVYAVYDAQDQLQYIGLSRQMSASLQAHALGLPALAASARLQPLPPSTSKDALQAAWKGWIQEHGSLPPGNMPGPSQALWAASLKSKGPLKISNAGAVTAQGATPRAIVPTLLQLRQRRDRHANEVASRKVTSDVLATLCDQGYVILDGVLNQQQVVEAVADAERWHVGGLLRASGQQALGRHDQMLVFDMDPSTGLRLAANSTPESSTASSSERLQPAPAQAPAAASISMPPISVTAAASDRSEGLLPSMMTRTPDTSTSSANHSTSSAEHHPGVAAEVPSSAAEAAVAAAVRDGSGMAAVAAVLKGLPHALTSMQLQRRRKQQEMQGQLVLQLQTMQAEGGDVSGSAAAISSLVDGAIAGPASLEEVAVSDSLMLALYPGDGTHYLRHMDHGPSTDGPVGQRICDRALTAILYLNPEWDSSVDGGQLRLFLPPTSPTAQEEQVDIDPLGGRLVIFDSRKVEHEVRPTYRKRWAVSAWIPALSAYLEPRTP